MDLAIGKKSQPIIMAKESSKIFILFLKPQGYGVIYSAYDSRITVVSLLKPLPHM